MSTGTIIAITIVFLSFLGAMVFVVLRTMKKTDPNNVDTSVNPNIQTAQELLPFKDIKDGVIDMGGHEYRAIVECSSTNYNLKTAREKETIEATFQRFLNSLTHPITVFVQTRTIDNTKMILQLEKELVEAIKANPLMEKYANEYFLEMQNLSGSIGNNKQKRKYIIVPFNEGNSLPNLTEQEKYDYSVKETRQRAYIIMDGLSAVGVKCTVLGSDGIAELIYSSYHKDNYAHVESVINGEFMKLLVSGENKESQMTNDMRMDFILYEAQMRIANEIVKKDMPKALKDEYQATILKLDKLRDGVGGYYKKS